MHKATSALISRSHLIKDAMDGLTVSEMNNVHLSPLEIMPFICNCLETQYVTMQECYNNSRGTEKKNELQHFILP